MIADHVLTSLECGSTATFNVRDYNNKWKYVTLSRWSKLIDGLTTVHFFWFDANWEKSGFYDPDGQNQSTNLTPISKEMGYKVYAINIQINIEAIALLLLFYFDAIF